MWITLCSTLVLHRTTGAVIVTEVARWQPPDAAIAFTSEVEHDAHHSPTPTG